jgi:hypothetical protein
MQTHTCRDDDQLAAMQGLLQLCWACVALDLGCRADVAEVACHACCVGDIVQAQLPNQGAVLEQQRQGLTDATGCSQHSHLGLQRMQFGVSESAGCWGQQQQQTVGLQRAHLGATARQEVGCYALDAIHG